MTTILHIASSSNLHASVTRQVGSVMIDGLKANHSDVKVIERDLLKTALPHLSPAFLGAMFSGNADAPELALSNQLVDEVLASDIVVVEVPMHNFTVPSVLKAWIDHIVRPGRTFRYGAQGPEGLVKGKHVILILGRGGVYSEGPMKAMDYQETYLRAIFGFMGMTEVDSIAIEGVSMGSDQRMAALEGAKKQALALSEKAA